MVRVSVGFRFLGFRVMVGVGFRAGGLFFRGFGLG